MEREKGIRSPDPAEADGESPADPGVLNNANEKIARTLVIVALFICGIGMNAFFFFSSSRIPE